MKILKFLLVGIFFGIVLVKSEAVSWYRIYEMFRFQSFHMYGIIGTAIASGIVFLQISKKGHIKSIKGANIFVPKKEKGLIRYIVGGIIFGFGWALIGACPGPMYILLGTGVWSMFIVIVAAIIGTLIYGIIKNKLPH
ncbi:YeeE/YedE thiosulfate transporter family protein [Flaviramulus aquimarinus]|uniref:YeeE/YedE thiosulfate transporter family protein n=1 Tax=Flaviramulus aquimarinus TaxID=1170456 RepID=A0ABP9EQ39_9FLAO